MTLDEYLRSIRASTREDILKKLRGLARESAITHQMVQNLLAETRFEREDWASLTQALARAEPENLATQQAICRFCRARAGPSDGAAQVDSGIVFGRAVDLKRFCKMLVKLEYHNSEAEARAALRVIMGMPPSSLPSDWGARDIGYKLMWSTFDENAPKHPFGSPVPSAATILCGLGLVPGRGPTLLLQYRLPDDVGPCIPTFRDAYASSTWSRYFRPAPPGARFGRTMPREACPVERGRPEVVHAVITAGHLEEPLRYAP